MTVTVVVPVTPPDSTLIVAVPGERANTCPVDGSTTATRGSLLVHAEQFSVLAHRTNSG